MNAFAPPMGHDKFEALAVAWAIDSLEPADQVIFEEHREGCAICERTVLATLEVAAELAYGVPDIEPPPQLRRRILAAATPRPPAQGTSPEDEPRQAARTTSSGDADWRREDDEDDFGGPAGFAALNLFGDLDQTPERGPSGRGTGESTGEGDAPDRIDGGTDGVGRVGGTGGTKGTARIGGNDGADGGSDGVRRIGRPAHRRAGGARRMVRDRPASARSGSRRRRVVSVLAAAALVGISAVTTWEITRPATVTAPAAAADRTAVLSAPTGQDTVATVVVHGGRADVVTDALEPNPQGRSFFMWGVQAGGSGAPQVVGTFQVTTSGLHSYPVQLTGSVEDFPVLAISEEDTGSAPVTPSGVLGRGALDH